jgi:hypothetical protein
MSDAVKAKPDWIREAGPLGITLPPPPLVQKYRGGQSLDFETQYESLLSDESLDGFAKSGISLIYLQFYNGFGIEYEKAEAERAREFMGKARSRGIKTGARIETGALTLETLLLEEGEAHNWLQVNPDGVNVKPEDGEDAFRVRPCYNSEGFMRYMERICGMAADAGADVIAIDHLEYNAEPDTCRCPVCVGLFREFLRQQYGVQEDRTREAGKERFGHNSFTHVRPPGRALEDSGCADSPHEQEWIRFKDATLAQTLARLSRGVVKRRPQCAVGVELFSAVSAPETDLLGRIAPHADIASIKAQTSFDVEEIAPDLNPPVALRENAEQDPRAAYQAQDADELGATEVPESSEAPEAPHFALSPWYYTYIRSAKAARASNLAIDSIVDETSVELSLAMRLAFNPHGLARFNEALSNSFASGNVELNEELKAIRPYQEFAAQNRDLLLNVRSLSTVALLHDSASLGYDLSASVAQTQFENSLIDANIPYDLIFSNDLRELTRYRCIILANSESLSDEIVGQLEKFVEAGGGLLAMGEAGCRDAWRRVRARSAFANLFGEQYPDPVRREAGKGRLIYFPLHDSGGTANLIESLEFVCGGLLPFNAEAESGRITVEAVRTASGSIAVHAINPDEDPAHGLQIEVMTEQKPALITPLAPARKYEPLPVDWEDGSTLIEIEEIERYTVFKIDF